MTSVLAGTFNAFAFAGAGWIFSLLRKNNDYTKEVARHNQAIEELSKAKEKFYQEENIRNDKRRQLQSEIRTSKSNMQDTSKAFNELRQLLNQQHNEPILEDFYQPSEEMQKYQIVAMTLAGSGLGWLAFKLV